MESLEGEPPYTGRARLFRQRALETHHADAVNPEQPGADTRSKVHQVRDAIERLLAELHAGDPVPAERELSARFGVARETVRQALRDLVVAGRIRKAGRGTVVARPKLVQPLALDSMADMAARPGWKSGRALLSWEDRPAEGEVARDLDLAVGTPVMCLERILLADDEPIGLETTYLSLDRFGWLRAGFDPTTSLYTTISDSGIEYCGATERIETVLAGARETALLGCGPGIPLMLLTRRSVDAGGRPIERMSALYRGDRIAFEARLGIADH
ncbi:GntR family transcriptional regulator [Nocardia paucivorans]|uniref:GntR family transcriptional regulator n=1 Tax=Nocardia paucivorans TaxID=114259 RepID=UPI00030D1726|nr:GntR family transcriptional regulator [Nocardia paucivorans]